MGQIGSAWSGCEPDGGSDLVPGASGPAIIWPDGVDWQAAQHEPRPTVGREGKGASRGPRHWIGKEVHPGSNWVWKFGRGRMALLMATIPPPLNFLTQGESHRPDAIAL